MPEGPVEVSVIIPCYNEGSLLKNNVSKLESKLLEIGKSFELIFVDDCSVDNTVQQITEIVSNNPSYRKILNPENIGRGGAFKIGAENAQGRIIGYLDIDLEVSEDYLPDVIRELDLGADVCTVYRDYKLKWHPVFLLRAILSKGYKRLVRSYLNLPLKDTETGFKFFNSSGDLTSYSKLVVVLSVTLPIYLR